MDAVFESAETTGNVFIYLYYNAFAALTGRRQMRCAWSEIEISVLVHRGYLHHGNVHRFRHIAVVTGKLGIADGRIERKALSDSFPLDPPHMPGIPCKVFRRRFYLEDFRYPHQDAPAEFDIVKSGDAFCHLLVKSDRGSGSPAIIHPVAGFNHLSSFGRRCQFALI